MFVSTRPRMAHILSLQKRKRVYYMSPEIESRFEIIRRICDRGRSYFLEQRDSAGIDFFEHLENEVHWLKKAVKQESPD